MEQLILVLHVLTCIGLIALVLLQQGKGADIGAAFGGGASGTVFGSQGSSSFLFKFTATLATIFFLTSLGLTYLVSAKSAAAKQQMLPVQTTVTQPVQNKTKKDTLVLPVDSIKQPKQNKSP